MEFITYVNQLINNFVWGPPMIILLVAAGIFLSFKTGFIQFRRFGYAIKNTLFKIFDKKSAGKGAITPFQAMATALAGTAGTGNIVGVTSAITLGGAGAVFWIWVSALLGMCTKYVEVVLSLIYRERNKNGEWVGGPMYYIKNGLGQNWKWLATVFAFFGALCAFGIGNSVQVGSITGAVNTAVKVFAPDTALTEGTINLIIGVSLAAVIGIVIAGGLKRVGSAAGFLVPFMSLIYIILALVVTICHFQKIGDVFYSIFYGAFAPEAVIGGAAGITIKTTMNWGFKRGIFSHESGMGSAPIAHATADTKSPVMQGMFGIFEVFMDTIVICTLTAVPLLISGIDIPYGGQSAAELNVGALATVFGSEFASLFISVSLTLFAFSTILSWSLYGSRCFEYLSGGKSVGVYKTIYVLVIIAGATVDFGLVWNIADTLNGLMILPNLVALFALSGVVARTTRDHFKNM